MNETEHLENQIEQLRAELREAGGKIAQLQGTVATQTRELDRLQAMQDKLLFEGTPARVSRLESQLDNLLDAVSRTTLHALLPQGSTRHSDPPSQPTATPHSSSEC